MFIDDAKLYAKNLLVSIMAIKGMPVPIGFLIYSAIDAAEIRLFVSLCGIVVFVFTQ